MKHKPFADQESRDAISRDIDKNMLVEAAAGTGKTYELANRIMALVESGLLIEKIVAITFTKKAAGELADRVRTNLNERIQKEKDPYKLKKFKTALFNLPNANISTIHSFCERILREFPLEAVLDPDFEVKDEEEAEKDLGKIWTKFWDRELGENSRFIREAAFFGVKSKDIKKTALKRVGFRELQVPECPVQEKMPGSGSLTASVKEFASLIESKLKDCVEEEDKGYKKCLEIQNGFREFERGCKKLKGEELKKHTLRYCLNFSTLNTKEGNQQNWDPKYSLKDLKADAKELKEKQIEFKERIQDYFYSHLRNFQERFLDYYEENKREYSMVDFTDILIDTRNLLRDNGDIRARLSERFEKILVDEFQDTDPLQAEILFYLVGAAAGGLKKPDEQLWHRLKPGPGKLFLVGDPKQSIYRFRRADIGIYNQVKKRAGKCVNLTANFRAQPVLLNFTNDVFSARIKKDAMLQPEYIALEPSGKVRDTGAKHLIGVELDYSQEKARAGEYGAEEVFALARLVRKLIDEKYQIRDPEVKDGKLVDLAPEHILILFSGRSKRFYMMASAFEEEGFCVEPDREVMYKGVVVPQVVELLRALARPDDKAAVVSVLRGIFFGLSDEVLLKMSAPGISFNLNSLAINKERLPDEAKRAVAALSALMELKDKMSPAQFVIKAIDTAGAHIIAALGNSRSPDLRRLERLKNNLIDKIDSALSLESAIEEVVAEMDGFEIENALLPEPGKIRMQSVHKAKGMEAPVVILGDAMSMLSNTVDAIPMREKNRVLLGASVKTGNFGSMKFRPDEWTEDAENAERNYLYAEAERLRYVAATRARDLLIVPINNKNDDRYFINPMAEKILEYSKDEKKKDNVEIIKASDLLGKSSGRALDKSRIMNFHQKAFLPYAPKIPKKKDSAIENRWAGIEKEKTLNMQRLTEAAIAVVPVTQRADEIRKSGKLLLAEVRAKDGKRDASFGMEGGTFFHNLYEHLLRYPDIDEAELVEYCLSDSGIEATPAVVEIKAAAVKLMPVWKSSALFKRLLKADDLMVEAPFIYPDKESGAVFSGSIDIIFREGNKWSIIDLKSDRMTEADSSNKEMRKALKPYKFQLETYRKATETIMGIKISSAMLYFLLDDFVYEF